MEISTKALSCRLVIYLSETSEKCSASFIKYSQILRPVVPKNKEKKPFSGVLTNHFNEHASKALGRHLSVILLISANFQ